MLLADISSGVGFGQFSIPDIFNAIFAGLAFALSVFIFFLGFKQKKTDNLITLQQFLHADNLSAARRHVRKTEMPESLDDNEVRRVCSSFDFAGTLVRNGAVDKRLFLEYWRLPLVLLEEPLIKLADRYPEQRGQLKDYYKDFWWLIKEAKKSK